MVEKNKKEKQRKKKWLALLLLLLVFAGGSYWYFQSKQTSDGTNLVSGDFLPNSKDAKRISDEELAKMAQEKVDASQFNMIIDPVATFDHETSKGTLLIRNPVNNAYPISVEIRLDENQQLIYNSGAIEPGYEITEGEVEKELSEGSYPATATFAVYDPETREKRGTVAAEITINII